MTQSLPQSKTSLFHEY